VGLIVYYFALSKIIKQCRNNSTTAPASRPKKYQPALSQALESINHFEFLSL
jgi:hypothetical protein